jgi:hypothetical protein
MVKKVGEAYTENPVGRRGDRVQFRATSVSASADGDYYQLWLGPTESNEEKADPHELKGPYLIVQRQFEMYDGGQCYIEMHDEAYIGHFPLRLIEVSPTRLAFKIVRKTNNHVEVSFVLNASEFEEVQCVAEIIFGLKEPEFGRDDDAL